MLPFDFQEAREFLLGLEATGDIGSLGKALSMAAKNVEDAVAAIRAIAAAELISTIAGHRAIRVCEAEEITEWVHNWAFHQRLADTSIIAHARDTIAILADHSSLPLQRFHTEPPRALWRTVLVDLHWRLARAHDAGQIHPT